MSQVPPDLRYTKTHEWVRLRADGLAELGITDHAQQALGDLVFVEAPEPGRHLSAGDPYAVVESVKAASDVYCPIAGEVVAANAELASAPERINQDPYGAGWIAHIRPDDPAAVSRLLAASEYEKLAAGEGS